jgi:hypothetical protein
VRCRTDGGREIVEIVIKSCRATHGTSFVLCAMAGAVEIARVGRPTTGKSNNEEVYAMLYTIAVVLLILWLLGLVTSYTLGGFIHILLVVAVVMVLVNLISGRRVL